MKNPYTLKLGKRPPFSPPDALWVVGAILGTLGNKMEKQIEAIMQISIEEPEQSPVNHAFISAWVSVLSERTDFL